MKSTTKSNLSLLTKFGRISAALIFWVGVWTLFAYIVDKEVLLPSPIAVARVLFSHMLLPTFWYSIGASLIRVLVGYLIGCVSGVILAVLCFKSSVADALFSPVLSIIRAVPVASFIILLLVWIGRSNVPSFTALLMVTPIVSANTLTGLRNADSKLLEVCRLYHFRLAKTARLLYFPAIRPYFLTAARTSLGMAWKAGIAAEVLCSLSISIGGQIYEAKVYLETPSLFAWTLTVICLSMLIEYLIFRLPVFRSPDGVTKEDR